MREGLRCWCCGRTNGGWKVHIVVERPARRDGAHHYVAECGFAVSVAHVGMMYFSIESESDMAPVEMRRRGFCLKCIAKAGGAGGESQDRGR